MNLIFETWSAVRWVRSVTRAFFHVRPWTTMVMVSSLTLSHFTTLVAFFLPLKVILLAGSDGVPRYFRFFVDPDDKFPWIIGLSIGAVVFYMISLVLDACSRRLAEAGSLEVLQGANEIAVASRQREEAQRYYARFSDITANVLVGVIAFTVIGLIDRVLLAVLLALVVSQYLMTAFVLYRGDAHQPGPLQRTIRDNLSGYLNTLNSTNFLFGFFVILAPFLLGVGGNLLLAILSLLLLRQALGAISSGSKSTVNLWAKRHQVDPMVFRERQMQDQEHVARRMLRDVFEPDRRQASARLRLADKLGDIADLKSEWQDNSLRGVYTFHIRIKRSGEEGDTLHLEQHAFPRSQKHRLEHEEYLFEQVPRKVMSAPELYSRFDEGSFACQVLGFGNGHRLTMKAWRQASVDLMASHWCFEPPRHLVTAFNTSRPSLEGRLTQDFIRRLAVALDSKADIEAFDHFSEKLEDIRRLLSSIPVYIYNPELLRPHVVANGEALPLVMSWGRWAIEPIGASLLRAHTRPRLESMLYEVREKRNLNDAALSVDHLMLANQCRELERDCIRAKYRSALTRLRRILANPLVR